MIRNDETKRKWQRSTSGEKVSVAGISGARGSPLLPPPRHTRLTNETLSYVCSNYCRHSAYTRSTQRALKYYPRHLAPFPVPHEKPPNGRSSSFVVVVAIAIIAVVVVVLVVVVVIPFFLPRCNSRVLGHYFFFFFLPANTFLLSRDLTRAWSVTVLSSFSFASLASLRTQHGARNKNRWWRWRSGGRLSKETRDIYDRFNGREKEAELLLIVLDQRFFCARWRFDQERVTEYFVTVCTLCLSNGYMKREYWV